MKACLVPLICLVCGAALCAGQERLVAPAASNATKPAEPTVKENAWVVRTFRLPVHYSWELPDNSFERIPKTHYVELESPPETGAADLVWEDYLRRSTVLIGGQLRDYGLYIPEGSVFLYDKPSGTLVVRTRESALKSLGNFLHEQLSDVKRNLIFSLDLMEVKPELGRRWLEETRTTRDHTATWQQAEAGLKRREVKLVHQMLLQTTSGNRVEGTCGIDQLHPNEISLSGKHLTQWYLESHPAGFSVDLDAVLGPDDATVDVSLELRVPMGLPQLRQELLARTADGREASAPLLDLSFFKLKCPFSMQAGTPMLIGAWKSQPMGPESLMQLAFLRCERQLVLPAENKELARRMSAHAEAVFPTAKIPDDRQREDFGMEIRSFRVPPTFLSAGEEPVVDARKILESNGIPFPPGAKAVYLRNTSTLVVKNLPEDLEMVEALMGCTLSSESNQMVFTLEVVEGPAEIMRAMQQEALREVDHDDALKKLRQHDESMGIRFLDVMRLISRSGQNVTVQSGVERMFVESVQSTPLDSPTAGHTTPATEGTPPETKPVEQSTTKATATMEYEISPTYNTRMVGTLLELQPSINSDGRSMEVQTILEKHFAQPSMAQEMQGWGSRDGKVVPSVRFHFAKLPAVVSMNSGTTRLIGIWKPEGEGAMVERDVMQAAFLRVDLVPFFDWR